MIRFLTDEDFDGRIVRGLVRRLPQIDLVRAQDAGLQSAQDTEVLAWAAEEGRVLLTHDVTTMSVHAYERIANGLLMPGVFEMSQSLPIGKAIEELIVLAECSLEGEWEGQVRFLPL
ncbi:MAG: DUF5615 family PIN-like protein [Blastocatellia bacterium]|nr:DUF5615 family PIN-like protein [Blastocatellia bacterium]